jgi:molybdenum cofactor cytidylyltransferase
MNLLALVTAAGASTRMGRCKALLEFDGLRAFEWIERTLRATEPSSRIVLITGADDARIRAALIGSQARVELLHNPNWVRGRSGGLALAARAFPGRAALVWPVDCPRVLPATLEALRARWIALGAPARGWLAPAVRSDGCLRHGHPVWIGAELLAGLEQTDPDQPLRALRTRAEPLAELVVQDARILEDFDTPEQLPGA